MFTAEDEKFKSCIEIETKNCYVLKYTFGRCHRFISILVPVLVSRMILYGIITMHIIIICWYINDI